GLERLARNRATAAQPNALVPAGSDLLKHGADTSFHPPKWRARAADVAYEAGVVRDQPCRQIVVGPSMTTPKQPAQRRCTHHRRVDRGEESLKVAPCVVTRPDGLEEVEALLRVGDPAVHRHRRVPDDVHRRDLTRRRPPLLVGANPLPASRIIDLSPPCT